MSFSVLVATLLQPSVPGHAKTGHVSAGEQWCTVNCGGDVRMSNHCDVTLTEWGPSLPLILSTIAFDECTGWLSFNWCISLICMGDLIGYLIGVTTFVKQHIHYNQILLCNWWQHFRTILNACNLIIIHWVKLMLILMGTNDAPLFSMYAETKICL